MFVKEYDKLHRDHGVYGGRWDCLNFGGISTVKKWAGVYAIFMNEKCVYVGKSKRVRVRIKQYGIKFDGDCGGSCRFGSSDSAWIAVSYSYRFGEELMREARLIRRLQPRFNKMGVEK